MIESATSSLALRRRVLVAAAVLIIAIGAAWYFWPRKTPPVAAGGGGPLLLVVSGDTQGWLTPCGCTSNQSGGLPRRGTYLAALRQTHEVLYADAGGAIDGDTPYHAAKLRAILQGEVEMQIVAHNLGAAEIAMGPATLRSLAADTHVPFLSTNASDSAGTPLADPLRIITADNLRIAFAGVVAQSYQTAGTRIAAPREAILAAVAAHKGQYDRLIVLAYLPEDQLDELARELPEADAVIGGPTGQSIAPHKSGPTLIASATNKGKFIVEIALAPDFAANARIVELNDTFADAADQRANVAAYLNDLARRDFPASLTGLGGQAARSGNVAGSESCQSCHKVEYAIWAASAHAHAWQSLVAKSTQVDPACQLCHTNNYGAPGGFASIAATPARVNAGCESCHGPSAAHVADPKQHTPFLATAQCLFCHDEENSPTFAYAKFWPKIRHGPAPSAHAVTLPASTEAAP